MQKQNSKQTVLNRENIAMDKKERKIDEFSKTLNDWEVSQDDNGIFKMQVSN